MKIMILDEQGYQPAIIGLSLSHNISFSRAEMVARKLAPMDGGHNKFLESMFVWLDIDAPRHWWQEADTYRISTKQSESTMHTIQKRLLVQDDFETPIPECMLDAINIALIAYQQHTTKENLFLLKNLIPEGFLQRRVWCVSYKTLRNILKQRHDHRQPGWREVFCPFIMENVNHPYFLADCIRKEQQI